jgi:hypothetical protein
MMGTTEGGDIGLARQGLGKILSNHYLKVPVNQRSYKWQKDHVNDLLTDIENAIFEDRDKDYFLGTVVFTAGPVASLEVADGQQRLATTAILIAAIRDYLHKRGDRRAQTIHEQYLIKTDLITEEPQPRLRLNVEDDDYFRKRVLLYPDHPDRKFVTATGPTKESHKNISIAADLAAAHISRLHGSYGGEAVTRILQWVVYLENRAQVISFVVKEHADAFMIFETLNDRGLELSKADLLKNYLFGRAGVDRIKEVQQSWTEMTGALETVTDDEITVTYTRHLWISLHGRTREKELYKKIKDVVKSKQAAVDFAAALGKSSRQYVALLNASHHEIWTAYPARTRQNVSLIRWMGWKQVRPLMLAVMREFTPKEVDKAFRAFVCWTVRFLIYGGLGSGSVEDSFADCAKDVSAKKIKTAKEILANLQPHIPTDEEFRTAFAIARVSKAYLARYYLRALEQQKSGDSEPEKVVNEDPADITLEHVLPQKPDGGWKHIDPEVYPSLVNRLGNLALLKRQANSDAKSTEIKDKAGDYAKSSYVLTKDLASYSQWGPDQIAERQKKMADVAVKTWPLTIR